MAIEIKAPQFPESVEEGSIATWHKQVGEAVSRDELIVDIETDKTVLEVVAAEDGVLTEIMKQEGEVVLSQELIGKVETGAVASAPAKQVETTPVPAVKSQADAALAANPAAKKLAEENNIDLASVKGTGKDGRILKEDVQNAVAAPKAAAPVAAAPAKAASPALIGAWIASRTNRSAAVYQFFAVVQNPIVAVFRNFIVIVQTSGAQGEHKKGSDGQKEFWIDHDRESIISKRMQIHCPKLGSAR